MHYFEDSGINIRKSYTSRLIVNSTLAVSNIRNRTYTDYEVYLIDYGYGNFKEKIHFMEVSISQERQSVLVFPAIR